MRTNRCSPKFRFTHEREWFPGTGSSYHNGTPGLWRQEADGTALTNLYRKSQQKFQVLSLNEAPRQKNLNKTAEVQSNEDIRPVEYRCLNPSEKDKRISEQIYSVWCGRVKDRQWRQTAAGKTGAVLTGICILPLRPTLLSKLTSWGRGVPRLWKLINRNGPHSTDRA